MKSDFRFEISTTKLGKDMCFGACLTFHYLYFIAYAPCDTGCAFESDACLVFLSSINFLTVLSVSLGHFFIYHLPVFFVDPFAA